MFMKFDISIKVFVLLPILLELHDMFTLVFQYILFHFLFGNKSCFLTTGRTHVGTVYEFQSIMKSLYC